MIMNKWKMDKEYNRKDAKVNSKTGEINFNNIELFPYLSLSFLRTGRFLDCGNDPRYIPKNKK